MSDRRLFFRITLLLITLLTPLLSFVILDPPVLAALDDYSRFAGVNVRTAELIRHELADPRPLDFLFVGGSVIGSSLDANKIEKELTTHENKPFRILMIGIPNCDGLMLTTVVKKFLSKKKVKHVFLDVRRITAPPTYFSAYFFNHLFPNYLPEWNLWTDLRIYGLSVLSIPVRLRRWVGTEDHGLTKTHQDLAQELIDGRGSFTMQGEMPRFVDNVVNWTYPSPAKVYLEKPFPSFSYSPQDGSKGELSSLRDIRRACRDNGTQLHFFEPPRLDELYRGGHYLVLPPDLAADDSPRMLAIDYTDFFRNIPMEEANKYYVNYSHLNALGRERFTRMLMPFFAIIARKDKL